MEAQHARHIASTTPDPDLTADGSGLLDCLGLYEYQARRYTSARDRRQRIYDTRRRVLGEDHPDTLNSAVNLAFALRDLGNRDAAVALLSQVVRRRRPQDPSWIERSTLERWRGESVWSGRWKKVGRIASHHSPRQG